LRHFPFDIELISVAFLGGKNSLFVDVIKIIVKLSPKAYLQ